MKASTPSSQALRARAAAAAASESVTSVSSSAYTRQPRTRQYRTDFISASSVKPRTPRPPKRM